eukprot:8674038-Pyramimonas_sp.AAC.1
MNDIYSTNEAKYFHLLSLRWPFACKLTSDVRNFRVGRVSSWTRRRAADARGRCENQQAYKLFARRHIIAASMYRMGPRIMQVTRRPVAAHSKPRHISTRSNSAPFDGALLLRAATTHWSSSQPPCQ